MKKARKQKEQQSTVLKGLQASVCNLVDHKTDKATLAIAVIRVLRK